MNIRALMRSLSFCGLFLATILISCSAQPTDSPVETDSPRTTEVLSTATHTPEPAPARLLSVCLGQEPTSLFLYGDSSLAARSVREAIYDGPYDVLGFAVQRVILEDIPSLSNSLVGLEPVQVVKGTRIVDEAGNLAALSEGVAFLPAGCREASCAQIYSGSEPVSMDQLVVRFKLIPGIRWSDSHPLTASDSVYSFEVARQLFPDVRAELIQRTDSYQALDETTVEWRGIPGYFDSLYPTNFFDPLPEHLWGIVPPADLFTAEMSARKPVGWGPFIIDEWVTGDHISLSKNPAYFRAGEGLPRFDRLVFRFVGSGDEALSALQVGECDLIDQTALSGVPVADLQALQTSAGLILELGVGSAWEHADFGILPADPARVSLFNLREVRQAIAMCIDRQAIVNELFAGLSQVSNSYVPPSHPFYAPDLPGYEYDPEGASSLLQSVGWVDLDNNPGTPRVAQGVPGVPAGTSLVFSYQTVNGGTAERATQIVQSSLARCGIQAQASLLEWDTLFAPGPEGPIFGRQFEMAQYGWATSLEPTCFLYMSTEIPGPYPDYSKGWGGANASGFSNPEYDQACQKARNSLPDWPEHGEAHRRSQAIFAEELPVIPLYLHLNAVVARPDLCGLEVDPSAKSALWNIENLDYGENCNR